MPLLDPWEDAARIAGRLGSPVNRLIVVLAAEAWCDKCRRLRPHFDALAALSTERELLVWLDIEEHLEFVGDYLPDDLPEVLIYRGTQLVQRAHPGERPEGLQHALSAPAQPDPGRDPGIAQRLAQADWARIDGAC